MLATARGAKAAAKWLQQTGLLPQFSLGLNEFPEPQTIATTRNSPPQAGTVRNRAEQVETTQSERITNDNDDFDKTRERKMISSYLIVKGTSTRYLREKYRYLKAYRFSSL